MVTVWTNRIRCKLQTSVFFPNYYTIIYPYSQMFYVKHLYVMYFICYYYMFRYNRWTIIPI